MCGIVGLLLKNPSWDGRLGELLVPMLTGMTERGPDSAGMAVFGKPREGETRLSLFQLHGDPEWENVLAVVREKVPGVHRLTPMDRHALLFTLGDVDAVRAALSAHFPSLVPLAAGSRIQLYKDIGAPADIVERYRLKEAQGTHVVAHTRMATESAVTPAHAHPFTAGPDFCLVHNGSLSNPHLVRKKLEPLGIRFVTDNDTEAACRFFEWRMREGDDLTTAVQRGFSELDGFFTFLMGTDKEMLIVRDAFACKPAVVAETDDYVAIASEFRSLAHLPGVRHASVFEPKPEEVYSWKA